MKKVYTAPMSEKVQLDPLMQNVMQAGSDAGVNVGTDAPARGPKFF